MPRKRGKVFYYIALTAGVFLFVFSLASISQAQPGPRSCTVKADCPADQYCVIGADGAGKCNLPPPIWNTKFITGNLPQDARIDLSGGTATWRLRADDLQLGFGNQINNLNADPAKGSTEVAVNYSGGTAVGKGFTVYDGATNPLFRVDAQGDVTVSQTLKLNSKLDVAGQINASAGLCLNGNCKTTWPIDTDTKCNVSGLCSQLCIGADCRTSWPSSSSSGGDITGVIAGAGLTGGGTSGNVTLNLNTANLNCSAGSSIRVVNSDGTVTCQADNGGIASESDTLQTVTARGATANLTIATAGLNLNVVGSEGNISAIDQLVGYNDLFIKSNSAENAAIYYAGSDQHFYTGDAERITVLNNGYVGIGTTAPNNRLQVKDLINFDNTANCVLNQVCKGTFLGYLAGYNNTHIENTAVGYQALSSRNSGARNSAFGFEALKSNTTGNFNVAIGGSVLQSNTTGSSNTAVGFDALAYNTTGANNLAFGNYALASNTTASGNTAIGSNAMYTKQTGDNNTAVGYNAGNGSSSSFSNNALFGAGAGKSLTSGSFNLIMGSEAGNGLNTGSNNLMLGYQTGSGVTGGGNNILLGYKAGYSLDTSSNNIVIGYLAGNNMGAGSNNNIIIGYNVFAPLGTGSNQLSIGNLIFATGGFGTGTTVGIGYVGIGTASPGAKLEVAGQIKITGGSPGLNKVLTSNTDGLASWETPAGGLPSGTSGQTLRHNGTNWEANSNLFNNGINVGIGTAIPAEKLEVFGNIKLNGVNSEGNIKNVDAIIGNNDLFLKGSAIEDKSIYYGASDHHFYTTTNGISTEKLTILNDGDVIVAKDLKVSGCFGPVFTRGTTNIYQGNIGGYKAANNLCNQTDTGSHVCSVQEILGSISCNVSTLPLSGIYWVQDGPPGFSANANDCIGWTSAAGDALGRYWAFDAQGGQAWLQPCNGQARVFACCK